MNKIQKSSLLLQLHKKNEQEISNVLNGLSEEYISTLNHMYNSGIKHLNANQLKNILNQIDENHQYNQNDIKSRLNFYEISEQYFENIMSFFEGYKLSLEPICVEDLDEGFRGVQVATRDDFNKILADGYTGDWVLSPENIETRKVQIASMNETGNYPRGYFINADIKKIEQVYKRTQLRHRIFIENPKIIHSGNNNIKFNINPVRYIN